MTEGGNILGMGIVPYFVALALEHYSWRTVVLALGVATGLAIVPSIFLFRPWFKYMYVYNPFLMNDYQDYLDAGGEGVRDSAIQGDLAMLEDTSQEIVYEVPPASPSSGLPFGSRYRHDKSAEPGKSSNDQYLVEDDSADDSINGLDADKKSLREPLLESKMYAWAFEDKESQEQYTALMKNVPFKLFCLGGSLYHFVLIVPVIFLVRVSVL